MSLFTCCVLHLHLIVCLHELMFLCVGVLVCLFVCLCVCLFQFFVSCLCVVVRFCFSPFFVSLPSSGSACACFFRSPWSSIALLCILYVVRYSCLSVPCPQIFFCFSSPPISRFHSPDSSTTLLDMGDGYESA